MKKTETRSSPLTIPSCPTKPRDASRWPAHRAKARAKAQNRSRTLAALTQEDTRGSCCS